MKKTLLACLLLAFSIPAISAQPKKAKEDGEFVLVSHTTAIPVGAEITHVDLNVQWMLTLRPCKLDILNADQMYYLASPAAEGLKTRERGLSGWTEDRYNTSGCWYPKNDSAIMIWASGDEESVWMDALAKAKLLPDGRLIKETIEPYRAGLKPGRVPIPGIEPKPGSEGTKTANDLFPEFLKLRKK